MDGNEVTRKGESGNDVVDEVNAPKGNVGGTRDMADRGSSQKMRGNDDDHDDEEDDNGDGDEEDEEEVSEGTDENDEDYEEGPEDEESDDDDDEQDEDDEDYVPVVDEKTGRRISPRKPAKRKAPVQSKRKKSTGRGRGRARGPTKAAKSAKGKRRKTSRHQEDWEEEEEEESEDQYEEEDSLDADEYEDDEDVKLSSRTPRKSRKSRVANSRFADESDESAYLEDDEDNEDTRPTKAKTKQASKKKKQPSKGRRRRKSSKTDSDEEREEDADDSGGDKDDKGDREDDWNSEDGKDDSNDERGDDEDYSDDDEGDSNDGDDNHDDDDYDDGDRDLGSGRKRKRSHVRGEGDGGSSAKDTNYTARSSSRRVGRTIRGNNEENDQKFRHDDKSRDSDYVEDSDELGESDDEVAANGRSNVDLDEDFLSDEASHGDERSPPRQSARKSRKSREHKTASQRTPTDLDGFIVADSETDERSSPTGSSRARTRRVASKREAPWLQCPSVHDEVTMEDLPKPHVCYVAPDGRTRHCFSLETLCRAALIEPTPTAPSAEDNKIRFRQPPHFRGPMEPDLLDQIASRFGRCALSAEENEVYKSIVEDRNRRGTRDYLMNIDNGTGNAQSFREQLARYLSRSMGHTDLYCCPLCYVEAVRRYVSDGDGSDDDERDEEIVRGEEESPSHTPSEDDVLKVDPMTLLGSLDDEEFKKAAAFCFRKVSDVKHHLRSVHAVATDGVEGNSLYHRFRIRDSDGLLQRHLSAFWKRSVRQTDMRHYWAEGHGQSFVFLIALISKRELYDENEDDTIESPFDNTFSESFPNRGAKLWKHLSAPYTKVSLDQIEDFLADDSEGDASETGTVPRRLVDITEEDPEERIVRELRKRRKERTGSSETESGEDEDAKSNFEEGDDDEAEQEQEQKDIAIISWQNPERDSVLVGVEEEEDEEEDDWLKMKRQRNRPKRIAVHDSSDEEDFRGGVVDNRRFPVRETLLDEEEVVSANSPPKPGKVASEKRIVESDEEEDGSANDKAAVRYSKVVSPGDRYI